MVTKKRILIIDAHPYSKSLNDQLAKSYYQGALSAGHEVKLVNVRDLKFNDNLSAGYDIPMTLEPDLVKQQELISWCQHLVIVTPIWWMGFPAVMKGYLDRVILPRFAFKYHRPVLGFIPHWSRLLKGRSARLIYTQGAPQWLVFFALADGIWRNFKWGLLWFCGFFPVRRTVFSQADLADEKKVQKWLKKIYNLGRQGK